MNTHQTVHSPLLIIGAGPGGYETALLAARRGIEVTLIEKGPAGEVLVRTKGAFRPRLFADMPRCSMICRNRKHWESVT